MTGALFGLSQYFSVFCIQLNLLSERPKFRVILIWKYELFHLLKFNQNVSIGNLPSVLMLNEILGFHSDGSCFLYLYGKYISTSPSSSFWHVFEISNVESFRGFCSGKLSAFVYLGPKKKVQILTNSENLENRT